MTDHPGRSVAESDDFYDADTSPLDEETLALIADELFLEYDAREAAEEPRDDESCSMDVDLETDPI